MILFLLQQNDDAEEKKINWNFCALLLCDVNLMKFFFSRAPSNFFFFFFISAINTQMDFFFFFN